MRGLCPNTEAPLQAPSLANEVHLDGCLSHRLSSAFLPRVPRRAPPGAASAAARTGWPAAARPPSLQAHERPVTAAPAQPLPRGRRAAPPTRQAPTPRRTSFQGLRCPVPAPTLAVLDHAAPQPVPPQAGQVSHDQQVPPPSGQGHVHALL